MDIGVYQIELNGKLYIGSSGRDIKQRWNRHVNDLRRGMHINNYLQNAFDKYGEESLKFTVLKAVKTAEECVEAEQEYLDKLKPEYNILKIAKSARGYKHTNEAKRKMSERIVTEETKQKISANLMGNKYNLGHKTSEKTKEKLRNAMQDYPQEARDKIGKAHKGKIVSIETRDKISKGMMGNEIWLGKRHSEETKQKLREARIGKNNPFYGREHTEETRRKMSESAKARWQAIND